MRFKFVVLVSSIAAALALLSSNGQAQGQGNGPGFVPNEVIVQFRGDIGPGEQARARGLVNGARAELLRRANAAEGTGDLELMRIPPGLATVTLAAT